MNDQLAPSTSARVMPLLGMLGTLFLLVLLWVPLNPAMPTQGLDASWIWGMNVAIAEGLAFGRDLVFTFGPYASAYTRSYHPAADGLMLLSTTYMACSGVAALCLLFGKRHGFKSVCAAVVMVWVSVFPDATYCFYPLLTGLVLLSVVESRHGELAPTKRLVDLLAAAFVLMPLGLLPLIKGSFLVMCVMVVSWVWLWALWRRQFVIAALTLSLPIVSGLVFWLWAGQSVPGIGDFFAHLFPIIEGYTEAMSLTGRASEWRVYLLLALAVLVSVAGAREAQPLRWGQAALFLAYLFVAFKAGFVRHDGHAMIAAGALLLAATLAFLLNPRRVSALVMGGAIWAWVSVSAHYGFVHARAPWSMLAASFDSTWRGVETRCLGRAALPTAYQGAVSAMAVAEGLPRMQGTMDLYPHQLSLIYASGNEWNPRPVLQSYSAYTPKLADMNRQHLRGAHAPDHLVFGLQPIDGRYPSLDDGASWPEILGRYRPVAHRRDQMWILDRLPSGDALPRSVAPVTEGHVSLGQWVDLPPTDDLVFARMQLKRRALGAALASVFKVPPLQVTVELLDGVQRTYRLPSGMADAGFLLSPLVETAREFGMLYGPADWLSAKKIRRFRIDETGSLSLWQSTYQWSLSPLVRPAQAPVLDLLPFSAELAASVPRTFDVDAACEGVVDAVNDRPMGGRVRAAGGLLSVSGWMVQTRAQVGDVVVLQVQGLDQPPRLFEGKRLNRPDVQSLPTFVGAEMTGFEFDLKDIKTVGRHTLRFGLARQSEVRWCPALDKVIDVRP